MKNINDMSPLAIELPEDILKAKWCGDFERADRLINASLKNPKLPECVKERLRIEKEILKSLPRDYGYTEKDAYDMLKATIPDMSWEEYQELIDTSAIDWIYINGKLTVNNDFIDTLLKVHPDLAKRAGQIASDESEEKLLLQSTVEKMEEIGKAGRHVHLKAWLKVHDDAFRADEIIRVHLPIPKNAINMQNINIISTNPEAIIGSEDDVQRTVYFEVSLKENQLFEVEYEYDSVVDYLDLNDEKNIELANCEQPHFETDEMFPHIRFTPFIKALCDELKGEETNVIKIARKFYDYCTTNVTYSFMREYFAITEIPEYCGLNLKGDCGVQALLFITLCRCAGIPAKWQSGLYVTPYYVGSHDWAMFYAEPFGWRFVDCSFGGSSYRAGNTMRHNHYFGNLDPFRMAANSEYQGKLVPEKKYLRIDPYDNQRGEVEYNDRGLNWTEVENDFELIECKDLY